MPNISEYVRVEEEIAELKIVLKNLHTKVEKEACLAEIRKLERSIGVEGEPYNSNSF